MNRLAKWLATCFGLGKVTYAPGTVTSAAATIFAVPLVLLGWKVLLPAFIAITAIGIPACGAYARAVRIHDPGDCVLDEVAGQWLSLVPVAFALQGDYWPAYFVAFLAFRLFDIWKPWPIWWADQKLPGGAGIMADDLAAGSYAGLVVFGMIYAGWM